MELQKKISVAKVFGKVNAAIIARDGEGDGPAKKLFVGTFYGSASGTKEGTTDYGDYRALTGVFRAINPAGEVFESGVCFLPDVALDMITGALDGGATSVDFAFKIYAALDAESNVGYTYRAEPLLNQTDNPLDRIAGLLTGPKAAPKAPDEAPKAPDEAPKKGRTK